MARSRRSRPSADTSVSAARRRIRDAGLRATPGRIATYRALMAARAPLTHSDVVSLLREQSFDRATIYRNLMDLTDSGLVARSDLGDHSWRFEAQTEGDDDEHVHFVCVACGDVACLPGVDVAIKAAEGIPRAVTANEVEVQLRGRCDACS